MYKKETVIKRKNMMDAKILTEFAQKAGNYDCSVWLKKGDKQVNGKSLLGLASLALNNGDRIEILTDGTGEAQTAESLTEFFERD